MITLLGLLLTVLVLFVIIGGSCLVYNEIRHSHHKAMVSRDRRKRNKQQQKIQFDKWFEAYRASTTPNGEGTAWYNAAVDLIESDPMMDYSFVEIDPELHARPAYLFSSDKNQVRDFGSNDRDFFEEIYAIGEGFDKMEEDFETLHRTLREEENACEITRVDSLMDSGYFPEDGTPEDVIQQIMRDIEADGMVEVDPKDLHNYERGQDRRILAPDPKSPTTSNEFAIILDQEGFTDRLKELMHEDASVTGEENSETGS